MSISLYYFSATGNSLTTAKLLSEQLPECRLIPVVGANKQRKVVEDANVVGFVFPIYYGTMPYPVRELIGKMVFQPDTYIFTVTTYRGHDRDSSAKMDQLLRTRGQKLSLGTGLNMPGNSNLNPPETDAAYLREQQQHVDEIVPMILNRAANDYYTTEILSLRPVEYPNNFRGLAAEDHCVGCGICVSLCPMENIVLRDGKAVIGDDCATCLSCFHWCPQEAIWMSQDERIGRREKYHHPDVTLSDILAQNK